MIGTDIVEMEKIRRYSKQKSFVDKIFTEKEIKYARSRKDAAPHLATAFAAKEAVFKAVGCGWTDGKEVEILRNKAGKPKINLKGKLKNKLKNKQVMISLSYTRDYAVAFAAIEK